MYRSSRVLYSFEHLQLGEACPAIQFLGAEYLTDDLKVAEADSCLSAMV